MITSDSKIQEHKEVVENKKTTKNNNLLKYSRLGCLGLVGILFWYFALPIVLAFGFYKVFKKIPPKKRLFLSFIIYLIIAPFGIWFIYNAWRMPIITIIEPQNNYSVQADKITIKGKVIPKSVHELKINNEDITVKVSDKDGYFESEVFLTSEKNIFTVSARNNFNEATETVVVERIFTPEEKVVIEQRIFEEEAQAQIIINEQKKVEAKELAEQKAWEQSRAGKLCAKYPTWSKDECEKVANEKIWIGMTYDMLVESYGSKPNHANPSNYGSGTSWQWCWTYYTPSCFYDRNNDGIIDAYN